MDELGDNALNEEQHGTQERRGTGLRDVRQNLAEEARGLLSENVNTSYKKTHEAAEHKSDNKMTINNHLYSDSVTPWPPSNEVPPNPNETTVQSDQEPSAWPTDNSHEGRPVFGRSLFSRTPSQTYAPGNFLQTKQSAHDKKVISALELIRQNCLLVRNETKSLLLLDRNSGKLLPATPDAIEGQLQLAFLNHYQQDLSSKAVKAALTAFRTATTPDEIIPCYGRAGYDSERNRYIFLGHDTIKFSFESPSFTLGQQHAYIEPKSSLPYIFNPNFGNTPATWAEHLFEVTDLPSDHDLLMIAWCILSWMPDRMQVLLELLGDTPFSAADTQSTIKSLLDPSTEWADPQLPQNLKQLNDCALRNYLLSFDRVDELSTTIQKGLLQLLDGKSISWRSKATYEPTEIKVVCPAMLNSMESVVTYEPLADRTLTIELSPNKDTASTALQDQATKTLLNNTFSGLLSVFGYVNNQWTLVEKDLVFDKYGGLRDLCRIGVLVARSLNRDDDEFWDQLKMNQMARREFELGENPIAQALFSCFKDNGESEIVEAVKDWLELLDEYRPDSKQATWPSTPRALGAQFKLAAPILHAFGIKLEPLDKRSANRRWRLHGDLSL